MSRIGLVAGAAGLLVLGAVPAFALGDSSQVPGVPSVSLPDVTVPTLPVPTPTVPDPPPGVPDPAPPVPVPDPGGSVGGDGPVGSADPGGSASDLAQDATGSAPAGTDGRESDSRRSSARARGTQGRVASVETRPSRFKTRGDDHRGTTLRVRLTRAGLIRFTVFELAPSCERVGSFVRPGRRGLNEYRFSGRVDGRPLAPGTYKIVAQPVGRGRGAVQSDRFVVVAPSDSVGSAQAQPSSCSGSGSETSAGAGPGTGAALLTEAGVAAESTQREPGAKSGASNGGAGDPAEESGVAGFLESFPGVVDLGDEVPLAVELVFLALLGLLLAVLAYVGLQALRNRHGSSRSIP